MSINQSTKNLQVHIIKGNFSNLYYIGIVIKPTRIPRPKKSNTEKQKTSSRKFSSNEVQKEVVRLSSPKISDNVKKISPEVDDDWNQIFEFQSKITFRRFKLYFQWI